MPEFLTRRQGFWHFVRRVPETFAALDRRGIVKRTTHIRIADDPRGVRAARAAAQMNGELEAYWQGLAGGQSAEAKARYEAARKRAWQLGFSYMPAAEVAAQPLAEILARIEALIVTPAWASACRSARTDFSSAFGERSRVAARLA
ncbi:hypothetical protein LRS73_05250 [Methylobacterium currus]|uniref:hypothetical protein n=1 Tax=Methylobacterium currus TaxID=2051553 RepID=UPI001E446972|nr:hypothetical protein [Methylobacterium currus]UHC17302.1 hypothetical protein LRS73_05250 [Methylobacterium currus]